MSFRLDRVRAELCCQHHLAVLKGGKEPLLSGAFALDAEFHILIAISCGNPFFHSVIERQTKLRRLVEYESLQRFDRKILSCHEHMNILDAIEEGDINLASVLMKQHLISASKFKPEFNAGFCCK